MDLAATQQAGEHRPPPLIRAKPRVIDLTVRADDRGWLVEGTHNYDLPQDDRRGSNKEDFMPRFGQLYLVHSRVRGTVRGFHRHTMLWDYFQVAAGTAKFIVWSGKIGERHEVRTAEFEVEETLVLGDGRTLDVYSTMEVVLTVEAPKLLIVPSGLWHGWVALEDNTTVVSVASELYNRENPDEERIAWDILGADVWLVKNK